MADDGHQRVDAREGVRGRGGLGPADVVHTVDHLALEVGGLDHVVVDHADRAHTRRGEVEQGRRPQPPGPDHEHPGGLEPALPEQPHLGDQQVPGVPRDLVAGERRRRLDERWPCHDPKVTPA